jgi:hypothetical protein
VNLPSDEQILDELRISALETLPQLIRHELAEHANVTLIKSINTGTDPKKGDLAGELHAAVSRSVDKLQEQVNANLNIDKIRDLERSLRTGFESNLADGTWIKTFRGRDILKRFSGRSAASIPYEIFRNLILSRMQDDGYQPQGMKERR